MPLGSCLCGRAAQSGELIISDNCFEDDRHDHAWPDMTAHGHYIVPLMDGSTCVGVLFLYTAVNPTRLPARTEALLQIGTLFAQAIVRDRQDRALERARRETAVLAERLSVATESAEVGVFEYHPNTDTLIWDETMYRLYGREKSELGAFRLWAETVHPEDLERAESEFAAAIAGEAEFDTRFRIIRPDGELRHIQATATVIHGYDGSVSRVVGANWDITETQTALDSLEESQRVAQLGSWSYDLRTGRVSWSRELFRIYGRDPEGEAPSYDEVLADYDDESAARLNTAVQQAAATGTPYTLVLRTDSTRTGDRYIRAEGRARKDQDGNVVALFGTAMDITEQIEYEQSLANLKERLRLFVEHAPAAIAMFDTEMRYVHVSRGWYEQYGLSRRDLIGRSHYEVFPTIPERWKALHERALEGETIVSERDSFENENGETIWVRYVLCPWREGNGSVGGMMMFTDVINNQVYYERRLEEARDRAEAASKAKSDFLANMSHEIRTPMTAILGYADLLAGDFEDDPAQAEHAVQVIQSNASHLLAIINDILDVSKIEAGQMTVERIETDLIGLIEDVTQSVERRATGKGVDLRVRYDSAIPARVMSDPTRIRQILLNLLGNAIKFTEYGSVTVGAAYEAGSSMLTLRVEDTGIGMSAPQRDEIAKFRAFTQADASTTRRFGGTGLGLRISNGLAELMGGSVSIESEAGEGTTVVVTLRAEPAEGAPLIEPGASARSETPVSPAPAPVGTPGVGAALHGTRVLLAEDGPDNMRLISFLLRKAGAEVIPCENGWIAAEHLERAMPGEQPDVVLMDMQMPELDGYGATRRLRRGGCEVPIIALTAHAMDGDRDRCLEAGCDDYLTKPVDRAALIDACARWAARGGSGEGQRAA